MKKEQVWHALYSVADDEEINYDVILLLFAYLAKNIHLIANSA
jgi:hypothetical protein